LNCPAPSVSISRSGVDKTAKDLKGKTVGSPEWAHTAAVYMRGWLGNEVGIKLQDIHRYQAGANAAGRIEKVELDLSALHLRAGHRAPPREAGGDLPEGDHGVGGDLTHNFDFGESLPGFDPGRLPVRGQAFALRALIPHSASAASASEISAL
jgi:hypothetical protein